MTPEEAKQKLAEVKTQSDTMEMCVDVLNLFQQYVHADDRSDLEKLTEQELGKVANELMDSGRRGVGGELILLLASMVVYCGDPEIVQEYISHREHEIAERFEALHRDDSD